MPRAPRTTSIKATRVSSSNKTIYYCKDCKEWKTDYNRHYNEVHADPDSKTRFMCPFEDSGCKRSSGQRHNLNRHIRKHLDIPLHCSICADTHWGEDTLSRHYTNRHSTSLAQGHGERIVCPWIANEEAGVPAYTKQPREVPLRECPVEGRGRGKGPYKKRDNGRKAHRAPSPSRVPTPAPTAPASEKKVQKSPSPVLEYPPPPDFSEFEAPIVSAGASSAVADPSSSLEPVNPTSSSSFPNPNVVHTNTYDELFPDLQLQYPDPSAVFLPQLPDSDTLFSYSYSSETDLSSSFSSAYTYGTDPSSSESFSNYTGTMDPNASFSSVETQWSSTSQTVYPGPVHEPMPSGYSMYDSLFNFGLGARGVTGGSGLGLHGHLVY